MSCRTNIASSLYDRQLKIEMFKRIHGTNFGLISKVSAPVLGPTSYYPKTMEEIYRGKPCSKYGSFYQQSPRFPSTTGKSKHRCASNRNRRGLWTIPDEILRENEFQRRFNAIRFDRQTARKSCWTEARRAPPMTLYEKSSFTDELRRKQTGIYGPYVQLAEDHRSSLLPEWYKGPTQHAPRTLLETLFSRSNRYKGKFSPRPSARSPVPLRPSPGPTDYSPNIRTKTKLSSSVPFLSSTDRFPSKLSPHLTSIGPALYNPHLCHARCSKENKVRR